MPLNIGGGGSGAVNTFPSRFAEADRELCELRGRFPKGGPEYVRELVIVEVVLSRCEPGTIETVLEDCHRQLLEAGAHSDAMSALLNTLRAISELQAGRLDTAQIVTKASGIENRAGLS